MYGDKDAVVSHAGNSEVVYERYKELGRLVEWVVKPGQDPVVKFFTDALGAKQPRPTHLSFRSRPE